MSLTIVCLNGWQPRWSQAHGQGVDMGHIVPLGLMTLCVLGDIHPDIILLMCMCSGLLLFLLLLLVSVGAGHPCCSSVVVICPGHHSVTSIPGLRQSPEASQHLHL